MQKLSTMSGEGFMFVHDMVEVRICGQIEKGLRGGEMLYLTTLFLSLHPPPQHTHLLASLTST